MTWKQFTEDWFIINLISIPFLEMILKIFWIKRKKEIFIVISNFHRDKVSFEQRLVSKKLYGVRWKDIEGVQRDGGGVGGGGTK